jgi:antitoxin PrlF
LLECKERRILRSWKPLSAVKDKPPSPKPYARACTLKPGDRFKFFFHPDGVIILPKISTSRLKGIIPKPARSVSLEEIDAAIEAGATERFRRKK